MFYIIIFFLIILFGFNIFIFVLEKKLKELEYKTRNIFKQRTNLLPAIYEVSKPFLVKHEEIFKEILILRKTEFFWNESNLNFSKIIEIESKIHHELNFIFKVCNKHPKLLKNWKFIYLREILIEKSSSLSKKIELYKLMSKKYNSLLLLDKILIIGLIVPFKNVIEI
jgi:hypothetical protein